MSSTVEFLVRHGYVVLFVWILAEQLGLPLPSGPLLLAAGALAGTRRMNFAIALALPLLAVAICDCLWYQLGRRRGVKILKLVCRISIEPDSCVRQTQVRFARNGPLFLLVAKFIPGLNSMASPLAGVSRMPWQRYALFDAVGCLLWVISYTGTGYAFSNQLERVASLGRGFFAFLVVCLLLYIGWKYFNRRRFLKKLRIARITPAELNERIQQGEKMIVVDLRHAMEFESEPETIPGAVQMDASELEEALDVIPRDREIVLFCSCPNEATAAHMALLLRSHGITRIRPLLGGLDGWRACGFAVQPLVMGENQAGTIDNEVDGGFKPGAASVQG